MAAGRAAGFLARVGATLLIRKYGTKAVGRSAMSLAGRALSWGRGVAGRAGRFVGRNGLNILNGGANAAQVAGSLGQVVDEITVRISGGPRSESRALFRLAAAIAFGKVKRLVPAGGENNPLPPPGMIGIHYSVESREVMFILRLSQSIMTITTFGDGADAISALPVFAGPDMTTVGGAFDFRPPTAPGAPTIKPAVLEFAGKTLLTDQTISPDPNPVIAGPGQMGITKNHRPSGDARSRGMTIRMVTAALATPAETGPSTFNLPEDNNRFTGG